MSVRQLTAAFTPARATMDVMLIEQIRSDLNDATRSRDAVTQLTLRSLIAAIQEAQVAGDQAVELDDDGILQVLKAQAKRRVDAAEAFESGGATERGAAERAEKLIIENYLPAALSESDVATIVDRVMADNGFGEKSDMGKAMKAVNTEVAGRADGRIVAEMVKSRLA
ncbi:MAG: hypothetical protein ACI9CV_000731 [Ilumatobacter sp.]|jgi:uncharacterized protein YqeY